MNFHNDYDDGLRSDYYLSVRRMGAPTSIQNINQIDEMTKRLNEGIQNVEVGTVQPDLFEQIPKQHFQEIHRLGKLTGAKASMHAPIIDPAGFTQQGWTEHQRKENERRIINALERAHDLDPKGNTPVTIHVTGGVPSYEWEKGFTPESVKGTPEEKREHPKAIIAIDRESKRLVPLEYEKKHFIGREEEYTPERRLREINETQWDNEKLKIMSYQKEREDREDRIQRIAHGLNLLKEGHDKEVLTNEQEKLFEQRLKEIGLLNRHVEEIDKHIRSGLQEMYHKYIEFGVADKIEEKKWEKSEEKEVLEGLKRKAEERARIEAQAEEIAKRKGIEAGYNFLESMKEKMPKITSEEMLSVLSHLPAPKQITPVEDFAREKTVETISNAALQSYKNFGNNAPIISLENYLPELVGGRAENLKKAVIESRKQFAEKLVKEQNLSKNEAERVAEKLIGVTWDVGHIYFLKKSGYSKKDIEKEAEIIAPYVKHLHVTDNFGYSDSHLPPGLGDVNIKEQLKIIEKKLAAEGVSEKDMPRAIVEAGAFAAGFKTSPQPYALEYLESPVSSLYREPSWAALREQYGHYMLGYGDILPEQHFQSLYGSGFSGLPRELGGQAGGERSRFAGTPNE